MLRLLCALLLLLFGCDHDANGGAVSIQSHERAAAGPRKRQGGMDVTFLVTADTHFGFDGVERIHDRAIEAMNAIEGRTFPEVIGGRVGKPRGVLVAGDLTEDGKPAEWAAFEAYFGLKGEGRLAYPVYETYGNHDKHHGVYVKEQMARRHGDVRYSWDWQDVHIAAIGEAPDDEDLSWLAEDLRRTGPDVGMMLLFHFPLEGPYAEDQWFGEGDYRDKLRDVLEGYKVLGIFHGHYHATGAYRWRDIHAYNPGSVKHGGRSFLVVRINDQRMSVAAYSYMQNMFIWWHDKPIFGATGKEQLMLEGAIVGHPGWNRRR